MIVINVTIWPFAEAPEAYRNLSTNGGDEDWVALVPAHLVEPGLNDDGMPRLNEWVAKLIYEHGWPSFSSDIPKAYPQADGSVVFIGAHT